MSKYSEAAKLDFLARVAAGVKQFPSIVKSCKQTAKDIQANWLGFASREEDQAELLSTGLAFAQDARAKWDVSKADLAHALDVVASCLADHNGNPLNRQALLDEIAAVPEEN